MVFGFLPSKEKTSYISFFEMLKTLLNDTLGDGVCNLEKILCDFEKAIHNGVRHAFDGKVKIQGCFFHFSLCIWKK